MILDNLLHDAGMTKPELANNMSISIKTIYAWTHPPGYAVAYLEAITKLRKYEALHKAIKELRE